MKNLDFTIKGGFGKYSNLDKEYNNFIIRTMRYADEKSEYRWETYNLIMEELLNIGFKKTFEEVKYRLTDNENPNKVMLEIIKRESNSSGLLWFMKKRIEEYIEEDFFLKFTN